MAGTTVWPQFGSLKVQLRYADGNVILQVRAGIGDRGPQYDSVGAIRPRRRAVRRGPIRQKGQDHVCDHKKSQRNSRAP